MNARPYQLEVFDAFEAPQQVLLVEAAAFEIAKREAYQQGYAAGQDDAQTGRAAQDAHARDALLQQLQDCSFTYHEARQAILRSIEPVLTAIIDTVLPGVMRDLAGDHVVEHLRNELIRHADTPLHLRHHPAIADLLADAVARQSGLALDLWPDPSLPEGRFVLERGDCEVELDLDRLGREIRERVNAHLKQVSERSLS